MRLLVLTALLSLGWLGVARAQEEIALADRGPHFLFAPAPHAAPRPVDVSRTAVLREQIALDLDGVPLSEALREITRQTGLAFVYTRDVLPVESRVHLKAEQITVAAALTEILLDAHVDVLLSSQRQAALVSQPAPAAPGGTISGRVTDAKTGQPIAGATVSLQSSRWRATTTGDGSYRLADVAAGMYTLMAKRIGYAGSATSVTVASGGDVTVNIALDAAATALDEVVVTGTIIPTAEKALPSPITVITADQIQERNAQRVDQLLRGEVPGVYTPDLGSEDDISRLFVRGASDLFALGEVKTYVDGVEVTSSNFLSAVDPSTIDRVELIRGPEASTVYGSEALNGVLQIFTKRGTATARPFVQGSASAGGIQTQWVSSSAVPTYRGTVNVSGGTETFSYTLGASRTYLGEFVNEYRNGQNDLNAHLHAKQGWLSFDVSGRLDRQFRGSARPPIYDQFDTVPVFSRPFLTDANYQTTGVSVIVAAQATPYWSHSLTIGSERFLQEFVQTGRRLTTPSDTLLPLFMADGSKVTFTYTTTLAGTLSRSITGNLIAGVNVVSSRDFSAGVNGPVTTGFLGTTNVTYDYRSVLQNRGYFTQGQLAFRDALFLTAGVRAESNDLYGPDYGLAWSPRFGASWVRSLGGTTLKLRASYGKSIRPPGLGAADTAYQPPFSVQLSNRKLAPEAQHGWDAGVELYAGNRTTLQATYYDQTAFDLIDQVTIPRDTTNPADTIPKSQYQNVGLIKNRGWELQASASPLAWLTLSANLTLTNSTVRRLSPSYTGDLVPGDHLLGIPRRNGGVSVRLASGPWTSQLGIDYAATRTNYSNVGFLKCYYLSQCPSSGRGFWQEYPAYAKARFNVSRQLGSGLTAFLDIQNLGDSYKIEEVDTSAPAGRVTTAGLKFKF